jgi:hypothetical protein
MRRAGFHSAFALAACAALTSACSLGEGEGNIVSTQLNVADCWNGPFDLSPTFFAAQPYLNDWLQIRIQHGGDVEEVSDGATILVEQLQKVRATIAANPNTAFKVGLSPSVVPPGFPVVADPDPPLVHLTLYLYRSCHQQNSALYAISGNMTFQSLFDGNLNETDADQKLTQGEFTNIVVGDPRDRAPASPTVNNTSLITGNFKFYFQRGQPAQPFP